MTALFRTSTVNAEGTSSSVGQRLLVVSVWTACPGPATAERQAVVAFLGCATAELSTA